MNIKSKFMVFVGPDGSGKTTIIENLRSRLSSNYRVEVNHIRFNLIPRAGNLKAFIKALFKLKISNVNRKSESSLDPPTGRYIYGPDIPLWKIIFLLCYEVFDYVFGYFIVFGRGRDSILMFDRYIYDYYTEKNWSNTPIWFMNILLLLVPKPDYIFFLKNDPIEINRRKNELSIDDIDIVNKRIITLLSDKDNFVTVDTNNSPDDMAQIILDLISKNNNNDE